MDYYNEIDPHACRWIHRLIVGRRIAPGRVDDRSICDVRPYDLVNTTRAHFFAGIGGWDLALQLAGWPDDAPVWTGSCPCQPFSSAGKKAGFSDDRHLWPVWFDLIRECRPPVVFGEQVASGSALDWLDLVCSDMEREGYAVGAADLAAASVGAPHKRQRLYWVAYADSEQRRLSVPERRSQQDRPEAIRCSQASSLGYANSEPTRRDSRSGQGTETEGRDGRNGDCIDSSGTDGPWSRCEWVHCSDGRSRPFEPGSYPLAHGLPGRVGQLRGFGNAVVPPLAASFVKAAMTAIGTR